MRSCLAVVLLLAGTALVTAQRPAAGSKDVPRKPILAVDPVGHLGAVTHFDFTPDGRKLCTISQDNTIQVWDAVTLDHLQTLRLPWKRGQGDRLERFAEQVKGFAVAPDGKTLVLATGRAQVVLVHLETGRMKELRDAWPLAVATTNKVIKWSTGATFSADGDMLALHRQAINVWRGLSKAWQPEPPDLNLWKGWKADRVTDVQFAPDGSKLAACGRARANTTVYNHLFLFDLKKVNAAPSVWAAKGFVDGQRVAWSPKGTRLALDGNAEGPGGKRRVTVWTPAQLLLKTLTYDPLPHEAFPRGKASSPEQLEQLERLVPRLVFRGENELVLLGASTKDKKSPAVLRVRIDRRKDFIEEVVSFTLPGNLHGMKIAPSGQRLATLAGTGRDEVAILDVEPKAGFRPLRARTQATPAIAFGKKGYRLAWTGNDRTKLIAGVDLMTAEPLQPDELKAEDFWPPARTAVHGPQKVKNPRLRAVPRFSRGGLIDLMQKQKVVFTLYAAGQEWVVCTPEGYYAATPGGERLVGWHVNNGLDRLASFYPLERFRKKLYRPDVIALVLERRGSVATALKVANALKTGEAPANVEGLLPPRCTLELLEQEKGKVKVRVRAVAQAKNQPILGLRLYVDGRPFVPGGQRGMKRVVSSETSAEFPKGQEKAELTWAFTLPGEKAVGDYRLAVMARSRDAQAPSNEVAVRHVDPAKVPALHVLAVGINKYNDATLNLNFAAKDARELAEAFKKHTKGDLFAQVHAEDVLLDGKATRKAVLEGILKVRKRVKANDLFVVFFAGHGVKDKGQFYLLTAEANTQALAKSALSGAELRTALEQFPCQVLLMLDACHSAGFGEKGALQLRKLARATDEATRSLTEDEVGVAVMCAAMGHEVAIEKEGNGLFTRAVLQALRKAEGVPYNRADQMLYTHHLQAFVFDWVRKESGGRQHPFLNLPWVVRSFPVARFARK
jgi:WD40 repeat protein